nr:hypothetical protein [Streptomyces verrucosisporus]
MTRATASGSAAPPANDSRGTSGSASDTAAVADARKPARVIPVWMVARYRFGSSTSRARRAARFPPRRRRRRSWLSRNEIRAISAPANSAFSTSRMAMRARSDQ